MPTDVICGFSAGYDWPKLEPWVRSIKETGFSGKIVIVFAAGSKETADILRAHGVEVLTFDFDEKRQRYYFDHFTRRMRDYLPEKGRKRLRYWVRSWLEQRVFMRQRPHDYRFRLTELALRKYTESSGLEGRFLVVTDIRDVIFQRDPSVWLQEYLPADKDFIVGAEPCDFTQPWNKRMFLYAFGSDMFERVRNTSPINCGVIAGRFKPTLDLLLADYLMNSIYRITDQPTLNLIMSFDAWHNKTVITTTKDDWVVHASTLVGDQAEMKGVRYRDDVAIAPSNELYVIFHQYDRIRSVRDLIKQKYATSI